MPLAVAGVAGAAAGALVVWFGLYQTVALRFPDAWLDILALVLFLDVLAVATVLTGAVVLIWIGYGRRLPVLLPRLAGLAILAALVAWPAISGFGATTAYAVTREVLAVEILIGTAFLVAAILLARAWAIRAHFIRRPHLAAR